MLTNLFLGLGLTEKGVPLAKQREYMKFKGLFVLFFLAGLLAHAADPSVKYVVAKQQPDSKVVVIRYSVEDRDGDRVDISLKVTNEGTEIPASTFSPDSDVGENISCGGGKIIEWDAGADWNGNISSNVVFEVTADDGDVQLTPQGMVLIPSGINNGTDLDSSSYFLTVNEFCMDATEVTKVLWDTVYNWAISNGYEFDNIGSGKAPNHPVHTVNWYDCVKWCNARTEVENSLHGGDKTPYYTVNGEPYRVGRSTPDFNFSANGYRLPAGYEWEYAARGGLDGKLFPWGDTISHDQANYKAGGYHPDYTSGGVPYTSPAGSFPPNGFGLYDVSGNLFEWSEDGFGSGRRFRGGSWGNSSDRLKCSYIHLPDPNNYNSATPEAISIGIGFRSVCGVRALTEVSDGADPTAVAWEIINGRWIKNIYANGDSTISDLLTGKMWRSYFLENATFSFSQVQSQCENLVYAGYTDWALPDKDTLLDLGGVQTWCFPWLNNNVWSSTIIYRNTMEAVYYVNVFNQSVDYWFTHYKASFRVWPVREASQ